MTITVPRELADQVVRPGDPAYRTLRSTYTQVHSPAMVVLPRTATEVAAALAMARDSGLPLAVRSGGHSLAGLSSNDGGIVLDLSRMNRIEVLDRARRLVRIEPGARWSRVARALADHGLALSSGDHGNVGVGGLATSGGIGWMVREFGLTIDRIRAVDLVLPDGTRRHVDDHDPELYWAVRGAASTLGIVTAFTFEAVEISTVAIAQLDLRLTADALVAWDEYLRAAPRELTTAIMLSGTTGSLTAVYAGDDAAGAEAAFAPLTKLGPVFNGYAQQAPYRSLVPIAHEHPNVGQMPSLVRNGMVDTLERDVAELTVDLAQRRGVLIQLRSLGGAIGDVDREATAFANRHQSAMVIATTWNAEDTAALDWPWQALDRHFTGAYLNFDSSRRPRGIDLAFPQDVRRRVLALKSEVDPDGLLPGFG